MPIRFKCRAYKLCYSMVHTLYLCRSAKRKVLLPKPSTVYSPTPAVSAPSQLHLHPPSQGTLYTMAPSATSTTITPTPPVAPSPYFITQNTGGTGFTSSTRFPVPPVPVQNTVIVQQGGQSVYVQQQVGSVQQYTMFHVFSTLSEKQTPQCFFCAYLHLPVCRDQHAVLFHSAQFTFNVS